MASEVSWETLPLGELTNNFDSIRVPVKQSERRPGPFPYYGASGVVDHVDEYLFDGEYLLIAEDGENLRSRQTPVAFLATGKFWVNNHAHIVQGNGRATTRFLKYALAQTNISGYLTGSAMPKLTQGNMNRIPILTPPRQVQDKITDILGSLDDKIELNRRMNGLLERMARAIFKAWFIDFEPVQAKAAGAAGFPGMPQPVFDQLPAAFVNSELGAIPEGWKVETLRAIGSISRESITPADHGEETFEHFSIPAFDAARHPASELGRTIKSSKYLVTADCVLVSKLNPRFARVWLPQPPADNHRQICSTEFLVVAPKAAWTREYLYCQFTEAAFRRDMEQKASGTSNSHQRIKPRDFENTPVISSPEEVRRAFAGIVGPIFSKIAIAHGESRMLASLRDALLPKLISGEISAARVVEGAA